MLEAVIWDMDGVIIDSEPAHYEVNKSVFKKLGLNISDQEYNTYIGVSNPEMWSIIKGKHKLGHSVPELVKIQLEGNLEYLRQSNEQPIPGVTHLLESLKRENIAIGLASSSPFEFIALVLKKFNIKEYFQVIISGEEIANGKPAPDIFIAAANELKAAPQKCIVIEDSKNGVKAAKSAGMKCIGFQNKNSGDQDLSEADLIVCSLEGLDITILKNLALR